MGYNTHYSLNVYQNNIDVEIVIVFLATMFVKDGWLISA